MVLIIICILEYFKKAVVKYEGGLSIIFFLLITEMELRAVAFTHPAVPQNGAWKFAS